MERVPHLPEERRTLYWAGYGHSVFPPTSRYALPGARKKRTDTGRDSVPVHKPVLTGLSDYYLTITILIVLDEVPFFTLRK